MPPKNRIPIRNISYKEITTKLFAYLYLIRYICIVKLTIMRELIFSEEFWTFYHERSDVVQRKFDYVISIVREVKVVSTKFVKRLQKTDLYEMRVSFGSNEYRTILFAVNHENIIESTKIILLNAFMKKSESDYKRQIEKGLTILKKYTL